MTEPTSEIAGINRPAVKSLSVRVLLTFYHTFDPAFGFASWSLLTTHSQQKFPGAKQVFMCAPAHKTATRTATVAESGRPHKSKAVVKIGAFLILLCQKRMAPH